MAIVDRLAGITAGALELGLGYFFAAYRTTRHLDVGPSDLSAQRTLELLTAGLTAQTGKIGEPSSAKKILEETSPDRPLFLFLQGMLQHDDGMFLAAGFRRHGCQLRPISFQSPNGIHPMFLNWLQETAALLVSFKDYLRDNPGAAEQWYEKLGLVGYSMGGEIGVLIRHLAQGGDVKKVYQLLTPYFAKEKPMTLEDLCEVVDWLKKSLAWLILIGSPINGLELTEFGTKVNTLVDQHINEGLLRFLTKVELARISSELGGIDVARAVNVNIVGDASSFLPWVSIEPSTPLAMGGLTLASTAIKNGGPSDRLIPVADAMIPDITIRLPLDHLRLLRRGQRVARTIFESERLPGIG